MNDFNGKIRELLEFSASFERFKHDIEAKLNQLALSGLVKKDDLNQSIDILSEELKKAKLDAFAFDSARRTFGDELSTFSSSISKRLDKLEKEVYKDGQ